MPDHYFLLIPKRVLLFLGIMTIGIAAYGQEPIVLQDSIGCAPFTVQLDTPTLNRRAYVIEFNGPVANDPLDLSYTYTEPGEYTIEIFTQPSIAYTRRVIVEPSVAPEVTVTSCANNQVQVTIDPIVYDEYRLVFGGTDTVITNTPHIPETYAFAGEGTYNISVEGYYNGGAQNCPLTTVTAEAYNILEVPTLTSLTVNDAATLTMESVQVEEVPHYARIATETNVFADSSLVAGGGNVTATLNVPSGNFHCIQLSAVDLCSSMAETSEVVCTGAIAASAFPNYNEVVWESAAPTGSTYTFLKNGAVWRTYTAPPVAVLQDSAVECNVTYTYQLQITHQGGGESYSLESTVTGLAAASADALAAPTVSVVDDATVSAAWLNTSATEPVTYFISQAGSLLDSVAAPTLTYQDGTATPGSGPVCYSVYYEDVCANVAPVSEEACTIHLQQTGSDGNAISLQWTEYVGAIVQEYEVVVTDGNGGAFGTYSSGTATTYQIALGSTPPEELIITIQGVLANGNRVNSNTLVIPFLTSFALPDAFTPDGDGLNDYFNLVGTFIASARLEVYNRWGEIVYLSDAPQLEDGWNGSMAGQPAPTGVYTYYVRVEDINGISFERRGRVFLMRER